MNSKVERLLERVFTKPKQFMYQILHKNFHAQSRQRWEKDCKFIIKKGVVQIGKNCNFRSGLRLRAIDGIVSIGDDSFCNHNVSITCMNKITIGNHVKIANNCVIVDHDHDYKNQNVGYTIGSVVIENDVWIGANCVILKDTYIGEHSVIAAGSVVKGVVPPYTIWGCEKARKLKDVTILKKEN